MDLDAYKWGDGGDFRARLESTYNGLKRSAQLGYYKC